MNAPATDRGDRPRILHVVAGLDAGGVQVGVANLIERTTDLFEHTVCCLGPTGSVADRLTSNGIPVHFLHKKDRHEWTLSLRIARLCRSLRPDLVHTQNWSTFDGVPGARLARVPVLIHSEHTWEASGGWKTTRRRLARRMLAPLLDRRIVVSEQVRESIVRDLGLRADDLTLIRNGVDTERFQPPSDRRRVRAERGYSDGEILLGTVGRAAHVKNWTALLEAFASLSRRDPRLRLALVGDGPERAAFEREARRLDVARTVRFAGSTDDVPEWLASMDVFVLPSHSEAASIALLEAMSMALPVVATHVGGTSQIVTDGTTGRLVPPENIPALEEAILSYCRDEHVRFAHGRAGRERVHEQFSLEAMVAGYIDVYRSALASKKRYRVRE